MLASAVPANFPIPFANGAGGGYIRTIPQASQISVTPGAASLTDGFPPLNFLPVASGGVPPFGQDFNGILNEVTACIQWAQAGGVPTYNSVFSTAIGGYPAGAVLRATSGAGLWLSAVDNNASNPDTGGANWTLIGISAASQQANTYCISVAGGAADVLTAAYTPGIAALTNGMSLYVRAALANATTTPTLNVNGLGAKTIYKGAGSALAAGDIAGAGHWIELQYDTTLNGFVLLNPATGVAAVSPASIRGAFANLQASATGLSASILVSVDEIAVENGSNAYQTLRAVSLTINSAGAGANGLDTGALATSTWYSLWVIWNGTTAAGLLSLSATAPTMPSGYTHKARVGWIRTDGTGSKYPLSFKQYGRRVQYAVVASSNVAVLPVMASGAAGSVSTPTYAAVGVSSFVPTTATSLRGNIGTGSLALFAANANAGAAASGNNPVVTLATPAASYQTMEFDVLLESTNVYWANNGTAHLACIGWEDNL